MLVVDVGVIFFCFFIMPNLEQDLVFLFLFVFQSLHPHAFFFVGAFWSLVTCSELFPFENLSCSQLLKVGLGIS